MRCFKNVIFGVFLITTGFMASCLSVDTEGLADAANALTRQVSGQLNADGASSDEGDLDAELDSELACDWEGDINARAVPPEGDVIDVEVSSDGEFEFLLDTDKAYAVLFYQEGTLCAVLTNSETGENTLIGIGEDDFDFGSIEFDEEGNLVPELDCEEYYDSDEDGEYDYEDEDFDGDGELDEYESDYDDDGIPDEWDWDFFYDADDFDHVSCEIEIERDRREIHCEYENEEGEEEDEEEEDDDDDEDEEDDDEEEEEDEDDEEEEDEE